MTEEYVETLRESAPLAGSLGTTSTPEKQMVIADPDGVAFLRQLLGELGSENQNIITLQDDIELEARKKILTNSEYQGIVINLLYKHKKQLGISDKEISENFKKDWKEIFENQNSSFSNSILKFCKDLGSKEEGLKEFIDTKFWPEWANAVTLNYINKKKDSIIVLAPKVAGNSDSLKDLAEGTSFSYLYTSDTPDTPNISYLMKEYTNEETGVIGPFVLTSGKFSNHVNKFFNIIEGKKIKDLESVKDIKAILDYLNEDKNEKLKEEVMGEFQTYLKEDIVSKRIEATKAAIKRAEIEAKQLSITDLHKLSPKHENVLKGCVKKTVLPETQTQTLGK